MRRLFHYALSPYSRRTRLALAHKRLEVELIDPRAVPAEMETMKRLYSMRTAPVLLEENGVVLGDSNAIVQYLDRAYPSRPLWPTDPGDIARVSQVMAMVDGALATLIDLGTRYFALRSDAAWPGVVAELRGRAQASLDALGTLVSGLGHATVAASGWSVGDMWLYSAVAWLNGLPARAPTVTNAAQLLTLGWSLPASLTTWALPHSKQEDVASL